MQCPHCRKEIEAPAQWIKHQWYDYVINKHTPDGIKDLIKPKGDAATTSSETLWRLLRMIPGELEVAYRRGKDGD